MPYLCTVTIPSLTGVPADSVNMQMAVDTTGPSVNGAEAAEVADIWRSVWVDALPVALTAAGEFLSPTLSRVTNACEFSVYDITGHEDGSPHGSPIVSVFGTIDGAGASTALPSEVAVVATLEAVGRAVAAVETPDGADPGSAIDRPKQRHTGRFFFGPCNSACIAIVSSVARPSAGIQTHLMQMVETFDDELRAATATGLAAGMWSRADAEVRRLEAVSVDNAFDTQRRRGEKATIRQRRTLP